VIVFSSVGSVHPVFTGELYMVELINESFYSSKKKKEGKVSTVMEILLSVSVGFLHSSCRVGKIYIYILEYPSMN
jgi:hypothetical protein